MVNNYSFNLCSDELYHHGILGMKWGVRRYQNADGSLTPQGRKRYDATEKVSKQIDKTHNKSKAAKIGNYAINGFNAKAYSAYRSQGKSKVSSFLRTQVGGILPTLAAVTTVNVGMSAISMVLGTNIASNKAVRLGASVGAAALAGKVNSDRVKRNMVNKELRKR